MLRIIKTVLETLFKPSFDPVTGLDQYGNTRDEADADAREW